MNIFVKFHENPGKDPRKIPGKFPKESLENFLKKTLEKHTNRTGMHSKWIPGVIFKGILAKAISHSKKFSQNRLCIKKFGFFLINPERISGGVP